ncbi:transcription termination factor 3, mitochondrial [Nematolebias whitei]|uniref:transcription termination factor 3, mitochondrial n=1 Tax=Nematolebias whitei TaxID=451745 RepID=UPI0018976476|nr:transcription termination factor 3, mitochondrial [Nematolebias whitei]
MAMSSTCAQLCLRCRGFLGSKTSTRLHYIQSHHWRIWTANSKSLSNGLFTNGSFTSTQTRQRLKQHMCYYNNLTVKYLTTEAKENKNADDTVRSTDGANLPQMPNTTALSIPENMNSLDLDAFNEPSALEEISDEEAVTIPFPTIPPSSTSLRDYVGKSETLTNLVQLGVDLWKLEQRPNVGSMLLRLDFSTDVAPRLLFLKNIGVEDSRLGYIISHNPFILTEELENLQTRVNYLVSKKFSTETVASMVSKAPYLLNFDVKRLDNRLGFYQHQLKLSASNTRNIIARLPRLLCGSLEPVKENLKVYEIELGFKLNEIQHMVIAVPKMLTAKKQKLTRIFDFLHNTMKVPHHLITKFPQVFNTNLLRLKERHLFLEYLGKAQYDPTLPNFISLDRLVSLPDETFCTEMALATLEDLYLFQKTL